MDMQIRSEEPHCYEKESMKLAYCFLRAAPKFLLVSYVYFEQNKSGRR